MGGGVNSGLAHAPDWTQHRIAVAVADGASPLAVPATMGMAAAPFEDVWADVQLVGGAAISLTIEVLIWSPLSQAFMSQSTPVTFTAVAASKMIKFNAGGQRFLLAISGTFGGTSVNINCAGSNPVIVESA